MHTIIKWHRSTLCVKRIEGVSEYNVEVCIKEYVYYIHINLTTE